MSDLISRSELLKHRRRVVEYDEAGFSMDYFAVPVEEIKNAPTVEAQSPWFVGSGKTIHLCGNAINVIRGMKFHKAKEI